MTQPITVDIWSDIACPWCYIGKRKLEEGLRRYASTDAALPVAIEYHAFELSPDTPVDFEGSEVDFLAGFKGLPPERVEQMLAHVRDVASAVGLTYDMESLQHTKTLKAHQVLHLAKARGVQLEMVERLFSAYFQEGRHIGHDDSLAALAGDVGLDPEEVRAALSAGTYAEAVRADLQQAREHGINAVPFFVVDGRYGISGAQEPMVFQGALERVAGERGAAERGAAERTAGQRAEG